MPMYLTRFSYTAETWARLAGRPDDRREAARSLIESVDGKWGGELPFSVLYARDGKKARVLSGMQSYGDFEKAVSALLK